jgi:hypothetical protein
MAGDVFFPAPVSFLSVPGVCFSLCRGISILLAVSQKSKHSFMAGP